MNEVKMKFNSKNFKILLLVIVCLLLIGIVVLLVLQKSFTDNNKVSESNEKYDIEEKVSEEKSNEKNLYEEMNNDSLKEVETDSALINNDNEEYMNDKTIHNLYNVIDDLNSPTYFNGYIYDLNYENKKKYSPTDFSDEVKIYIGISNIDNIKDKYDALYNTLDTLHIKSSELDDSIKKIFGNISYNNVSSDKCGLAGFKYDYEKDEYKIMYNYCGIIGTTPRYFTKYISSLKKDNNLEITQAVFYREVYFNSNSDRGSFIYDSRDKKNLILKNSNYDKTLVEIFKEYENKFDKYKYTFEFENGNYVLKSVEKI